MNNENSLLKEFHITSISRADVAQMLMEVKGVEKNEAETVALQMTDDEMMQLANKMANAYITNSFWIDLEIIYEEMVNDD
jgi:hypothetical protein